MKISDTAFRNLCHKHELFDSAAQKFFMDDVIALFEFDKSDLRERAAIAAMQGLMLNNWDTDRIAHVAVQQADDLILALNKKETIK